jgi:catechol 2,3-dioxygenase-like lactoylglutathione lyase family enzyme
MTKKILLAYLFWISVVPSYAQGSESFKYTPYFSAVIVNNVDTSAAWYQAVFELKVVDRINDTANGFRVVILGSSTFLLELIENRSWPARRQLLAEKPAGTRIEGFFKAGFKVPDVDDCLKHLAALKVVPERIYTGGGTKKRNFLVNDPDGNLLQFFE